MKTMKKRYSSKLLSRICIGFFLLGASATQATPVSFSFSGTTANSEVLIGSLTYDTDSATVFGSMSIGSDMFSYEPNPAALAHLPQRIYVYNTPAFDEVVFFVGLSGPDRYYNSWLLRPRYMILNFGQDPSVLQSGVIPLDPHILNGFQNRSVNLQYEAFDSEGSSIGYTGFGLTPITVATGVPETASTIGMMVVALVGLVTLRRKRTK